MIVGVVGLIGSGKGTVGDMLKVIYGFQNESFAKPLKDAVAIIFNWPRHLLEGDTEESRKWREQEDTFWTKALGKKITPRLVLQWMGTEAGRNIFGESLWTSALINRLDPRKDYVITDVRFVNEIKALKEAGAHVIRVKRGDDPDWMEFAKTIKNLERHNLSYAVNARNYLDDYDAPSLNHNIEVPHIHRSEWDWVDSDFDFCVFNDGTLDDLAREVAYFMAWASVRVP